MPDQTLQLISFLGTGNYRPCTYSWRGEEARSRLFPAVLAELLEPDAVYVLQTPAARDRWWDELREELDEVGDAAFRKVMIPSGESERELWEVFSRITAVAAEGEGDLVIDITHGFRSLPLFALAAGAFLDELGQVEISHMLYGAYEAAQWEDPEEQQNQLTPAPVFDLTPALDLLRWTGQIRDLLRWGRGYPLAGELERLGLGEDNPGEADLPEQLSMFSDALLLNRSREVRGRRQRLLKGLEGTPEEVKRDSPPLAAALAVLQERLRDEFPAMDVAAGGTRVWLDQAAWYLRHRHFYQAASLLREVLLLALCDVIARQSDKTAGDVSNCIGGGLKICIGYEIKRREDTEEATEPGSNVRRRWLLDALERVPGGDLDLWAELRDLRNDLMHAQFGDQQREWTSESVTELLERALARIREIWQID